MSLPRLIDCRRVNVCGFQSTSSHTQDRDPQHFYPRLRHVFLCAWRRELGSTKFRREMNSLGLKVPGWFLFLLELINTIFSWKAVFEMMALRCPHPSAHQGVLEVNRHLYMQPVLWIVGCVCQTDFYASPTETGARGTSEAHHPCTSWGLIFLGLASHTSPLLELGTDGRRRSSTDVPLAIRQGEYPTKTVGECFGHVVIMDVVK